jgi:cobalamin biosynthesis protein CobT
MLRVDEHSKKSAGMEKLEADIPTPSHYADAEKIGSWTPRTPRSFSDVYKDKYGGRGDEALPYKEPIAAMIRKTNLPAKVRAHLMSLKVAKYRTGYRSGRLDTNRLTDVLRGRDDIFRRREEVRMVNTAVSLLVDASGSMSGNRYTHACAASLMMAEALQGIGVDVEIAAFTELHSGHDTLVHDIVSPFGRRFVKETTLDKLARVGNCLCENADGENILYAYSRLRRQLQPKKILIVLSDGAPSCSGAPGNTASITTYTADVIKMIEADKNVELWAIGIGYDPRQYKKRVVLERGGMSLEEALLQLTKKLVSGENV